MNSSRVRRRPKSPPRSPSRRCDLKILQLNVHLFPWSRDHQSRSDDLIKFFSTSGADVVCVTELWFGAHDFKRRLKKIYPFSLQTRFNLQSLWHGGMIILSKFPITDFDRLTFSEGFHADVLVSKGALRATIRNIDVFLTHLQAHDTPMAVGVRNLQLKELRKFTRKSKKFVLVGDLNIDALKSPSDAKLALRSIGVSEFQISNRIPTHEKEFLDYVAGKNVSGTYEVLNTGSMSDHFATFARVKNNETMKQ
jgi:endonuclease/exonuclease/phosphatase family metal-dependent hydrolase